MRLVMVLVREDRRVGQRLMILMANSRGRTDQFLRSVLEKVPGGTYLGASSATLTRLSGWRRSTRAMPGSFRQRMTSSERSS